MYICSLTRAGVSTTSIPVVPVKVKATGKGTIVEAYAFLDPGSNTSCCSNQLIDRLGAVGKKTTLSVTTMDNENVKGQSLVVSLEVCDLSGNNAIELPCVFSRAKLPVSTDDIPCQSDVDRWTYLEGIQVPHIDAEIDLLIGNDVPEVLQPKEVKESRYGGPYAVRTLFGWTINGPLGRMSTSTRTANRIQSSSKLNIKFEKFCEVEFNDSQFSIEKTMSQKDRKALSTMEQSVRLRDGHYEVALPWKVFPPDLPNNKMQAEQRLQLLKKRLTKDCNLHQKYSVFMNDLLEEGYAQEVPDDQIGKTGWYLPHHPITHKRRIKSDWYLIAQLRSKEPRSTSRFCKGQT